MSRVSIRLLGPRDAPAYRALRLEALAAAPEAFGADHSEEAALPEAAFAGRIARNLVLAAEAGGELVGLAVLAPRAGVKGKHAADLVSVYVRPSHRRAGLARHLVGAAVDAARGRFVQLHLGVGTENAAALALYRRAGFTICGTEPRALYVDGRYIDEHQMVRFLDEAPGA